MESVSKEQQTTVDPFFSEYVVGALRALPVGNPAFNLQICSSLYVFEVRLAECLIFTLV